MFKKKVFNIIVSTGLFWLIKISNVWADDPMATTTDFSTKMIDIIKGPVLKLSAAVVLLVGAVGLLRGRHRLAISCGLAFLLLLFLPILLSHV
ncbi:MAG: hypothetical protein HY209_07500 [Candidatus Omnitrophica bacterium]|nr:hypothetical protein [Candidatus Omnitrophota bacterium]